MSRMRLFYVTVPDLTAGKGIARTLVEENLIACANLFQPHMSIYRWKDEIQEETERMLIIKTSAEKAPRLFERLEALHPYDCPCIIEIDPSKAHQGFEDWINQQTGII